MPEPLTPPAASVPPASRLQLMHRLWRMLPARQRRAMLYRGTALLAPKPDQPAPAAHDGMVVAGELSRASGLGEVGRLMMQGLAELGCPAWPLDVGHAVGARADLADGVAAEAGKPPDGAPLLIHVNAPQLPLALLRLPRGLLRGRRIIGYWAWELPTVSPDWRVGVNFVHEVWTLSRFSAAALETLLPGRVRVVTPPLAIAPPVPSRLGRADFGLPDEAVVVLVSFNLASSFERKNPLQAIAAFRAAFGPDPHHLLVLKIGNPGDFPADFARLRAVVEGVPNIRLETRVFPAADSYALTATADIVLSLHRSEGFGLVPAEAMMLGVPVVATGWSGNMDFMDSSSASLVSYDLVPAVDPRGVFEAPGAVWAQPDLDDAVAALRLLASDAGSRRALGARGRKMAMARLGLGPLADALGGLGLGVRASP